MTSPFVRNGDGGRVAERNQPHKFGTQVGARYPELSEYCSTDSKSCSTDADGRWFLDALSGGVFGGFISGRSIVAKGGIRLKRLANELLSVVCHGHRIQEPALHPLY